MLFPFLRSLVTAAALLGCFSGAFATDAEVLNDPIRPRVYALQQPYFGESGLEVINPSTNARTGYVKLGSRATDMAISADAKELLAIDPVDSTISVVDLENLVLKEKIALPKLENWDPQTATADIGYGPGNTIYYSDAGWIPKLLVYDRSTQQIVQTILDDNNGIGDFALSPDGKTLVAWTQNGWSTGWIGSNVAKYSVAPNGTLTFSARTSSAWQTALKRDPVDAQVYFSPDGTTVFVKEAQFKVSDLSQVRRFPTAVRAITANGEAIATDNFIYDVATGKALASVPAYAGRMVFTPDYSRLIYSDNAGLAFKKSLNLLSLVGPEVFGKTISPPDHAVVMPPKKLQWVDRKEGFKYRVYLGTSQDGVIQADMSSETYLGEFATAEAPIPASQLAIGSTYFWRVDAVLGDQVWKGDIRTFRASSLSLSKSQISVTMVRWNLRNEVVEISVDSADTGRIWKASSNQYWARPEYPASAGAPSKLKIILDPSLAGNGFSEGRIRLVTDGEPAIEIPVSLNVRPFSLSLIQSDPNSSKVYAISQEKLPFDAPAFLLEIDSEKERVLRCIQVGSGVTDMAIHGGDNSIYLTNWYNGSLLRVNKDTLTIDRQYGFSPVTSYGYSVGGDVYRIAAGKQGRLVVEEQNQNVDVVILDTETGRFLSKIDAFTYAGGGKFGPGGRYFYHVEQGITPAEIQKFDTDGDNFTLVASSFAQSFGSGSRNVQISEEGNRIFWNGMVFDADLSRIGTTPEIYATTPDGKYAFGQTSIYDTATSSQVMAMPVTTTISAFNSQSKKLIVQKPDSDDFAYLNIAPAEEVPELAVGPAGPGELQIKWTPLESATGYEVRLRINGDWLYLPAFRSSEHAATIPGLSEDTNYEVQIRALYEGGVSGWTSSVVNRSGEAEKPPEPQAPQKMIYKMKGLIRQAGGGVETVQATSGYLIWDPVSNQSAQIVLLRKRKDKFYFVYSSPQLPVVVSKGGKSDFVLSGVSSSPESKESTLIRGQLKDTDVGTVKIPAAPVLRSDSWTITSLDGTQILLESQERYTLDLPATKDSNVTRAESFAEATERLRKASEDAGFENLSE